MKVKLMNSAMMPKDGIYLRESISEDKFFQELIDAYNRGVLESYIGYPQNAEYIFRKTGIRVPINRAEADLRSGDKALVMKLKYRVADPTAKGQPVDVSQYEYCRVRYWAPEDIEDFLAS
jgi:hypothetical protein